MVRDQTCLSSSPPHLTLSVNLRKQQSKDYLLRLAAASNPLIDGSLLKSKAGQAALEKVNSSLACSNFMTIEQTTILE